MAVFNSPPTAKAAYPSYVQVFFLHHFMSNGGGVKLPPTCILSYVAPMTEIPPV